MLIRFVLLVSMTSNWPRMSCSWSRCCRKAGIRYTGVKHLGLFGLGCKSRRALATAAVTSEGGSQAYQTTMLRTGSDQIRVQSSWMCSKYDFREQRIPHMRQGRRRTPIYLIPIHSPCRHDILLLIHMLTLIEPYWGWGHSELAREVIKA